MGTLSEHQRDFYRFSIERLLEENRETVLRALRDFADHSVVKGGSEKS